VIKKISTILSVFVISLFVSGSIAQSSTAIDFPYEEGTVLVGFNSEVTPAEAENLISEQGFKLEKIVGVGTYVISVPNALQAISAFKQLTKVRYAELNGIVETTVIPNDPLYPQLYGMNKISAPLAWDTSTGSSDVVVGITDTGINYNHEDLVGNIWTNPGGINGCSVGTFGFNAINGTCNPADDHFHGTHVSGTVGAVGNNNIGVVGVNWTTSLMGLKFLNAFGSGTWDDAIEVIHWAVTAKQQGVNVRVLSASWGGTGFSQGLLDELNYAATNDLLFVAAAGNSNANVDVTPFYPCAYNVPNMICVAASDANDNRASFSNYGKTKVHLAAPGVNTLSTDLGSNSYRTASGTSMATPHVSGAAALSLSLCDEDMSALRARVLSAVDVLSNWSDLVATGGRLNTSKLFNDCVPPPPPPPPPPPSPITLEANGYKYRGVQTVDLNWSPFVVENTINVYRDNVVVTTTEDDGFYTDSTGNRGNNISYTYKVCSVQTTECSNEVIVKYGNK